MSTKTASPGMMSLSSLNPALSRATDSDAIIVSVFPSTFLVPKHNGLIPIGSRNATIPLSDINVTTAYAPFTLR